MRIIGKGEQEWQCSETCSVLGDLGVHENRLSRDGSWHSAVGPGKGLENPSPVCADVYLAAGAELVNLAAAINFCRSLYFWSFPSHGRGFAPRVNLVAGDLRFRSGRGHQPPFYFGDYDRASAALRRIQP